MDFSSLGMAFVNPVTYQYVLLNLECDYLHLTMHATQNW